MHMAFASSPNPPIPRSLNLIKKLRLSPTNKHLPYSSLHLDVAGPHVVPRLLVMSVVAPVAEWELEEDGTRKESRGGGVRASTKVRR